MMSDRGIEIRKDSLPAHHSPLTRVCLGAGAHQKVGAEDPLPDQCHNMSSSRLCLTIHNVFSSFPVARVGLENDPRHFLDHATRQRAERGESRTSNQPTGSD